MRIFLLATVLMFAVTPATAGPGEEGHGEESESGLRSPDLMPGESWSHTFTEARTFDYHCHPHPWMVAGIEVVPSSGRAPMTHTVDVIEPEGKDFEAWDWSPSPLTIEEGDTVTWVNKGSVMHVVQETTPEHAAHIGSETGEGGDGHVHAEGQAGIGAAGWWILGIIVGGLALVYMIRKGRPDPPKVQSRLDAGPTPSGSVSPASDE